MANSLNLRAAEQTRLELTEAQQKEIERMYKRISKNIQKQASKLPNTTSGSLRGIYLEQLQKQINTELDNLSKDLESTIHKNMLSTSQAVVDGSNAFNKSVGISMEGMFSHVPKDVVKTVSTGQLYEGNWTLSKSIWGHTAKTKKDINTVIAEGIAQNKSAYDIAKELEKYVNPSSQKPWDWSKVYPGTSKQVDYNAQRLARTMVSHAYQQSFVRTTQKNPFVTKYKWVSSNSARICELCASRDGVLFEKDELPLDHPNGMCTFVAVIPDSMADIADRIADWALGKEDPDLDAYALDLGYTQEKRNSSKEILKVRVDSLPQFGTTKYKQNVIPLADKEIGLMVADDLRYTREENDLGLQWVSVANLETLQKKISADNLEKMIESDLDLNSVSEDPVQVVLYDGHYVIIDGNHRSSLAKLMGQDKIKAHVFKLPPEGE